MKQLAEPSANLLAAVFLTAASAGLAVAASAPPRDPAAAPSQDRATDPALAWVDPIITGPVSPEYKRQRDEAGCDRAEWPNIPAICFPK